MICAKTGGAAGGKSSEKAMEEGESEKKPLSEEVQETGGEEPDQLKGPPPEGGEDNKEVLKQEIEAEEANEKTPLAGEEAKEAAPEPTSDDNIKGQTIESSTDQQPLTEKAA